MKAIVPMLVMVVTVFILCWTPILIFEVLQAYSVIGAQVFGEVKHIKTVFSLLAYVNRWPFYLCMGNINILRNLCFSCINPLIYGFMSKNFRRSFSEALCKCSINVRGKETGCNSNDKR